MGKSRVGGFIINKRRREMLSKAKEHLETASDIIDNVLSEEENSLDNIPENLQSGDRYEARETIVDELSDLTDDMSDIIDRIENLRR